MSLAADLTQCQQRIAEAGRKASAEARRFKGIAAVEVYDEMMLHLIAVTAGANELKTLLGTMRLIGELELAQCVRRDRDDRLDGIDVSETTRRAFAHQLEMIGDDTLSDEKWKEAS